MDQTIANFPHKEKPGGIINFIGYKLQQYLTEIRVLFFAVLVYLVFITYKNYEDSQEEQGTTSYNTLNNPQ